MKTNKQITVYDLSDRYDGFYIEKRQIEGENNFFLLHKDYNDEIPILGNSGDSEGQMKYYIWANIEEFIEEFTDCIMCEEDDD